ncbi:MAG TPA: hypothetical protein VMZ28_30765 [Kofleriaceae bacterium]|nr:hypothetical protein [Kofleriaceae bacterium]
MSLRLTVVAVLLLVTLRVAHAQAPGQVAPGTGALNGSDYHAVAPLPQVYPSPMPSLPPPSPRAGEGSTGPVSFDRGGFTTHLGADGSIDFEDHSLAGAGWMGLVAWLTFDVSDQIMRANGDDPYVSEKLRIMDETFEERMAVRRQYDAMIMRRALDDLPRYLAAVWSYPGWSPTVRRRILFALWDEAAEDGSELVRAGGEEARQTIEAFIAAHLPAGSPDAYPGRELAELNRLRTTRVAFAPYDADPEVVVAALRAF